MGENLFRAPEVTPFVECPNCLRLLEYGAGRCPHCLEEIVEDYGHLSAAVVLVNTQAVSSANTIMSVEPLKLIPGIIYLFAFDVFETRGPGLSVLGLLWSVPALSAILVWFVRFGWLKSIGDADYVRAKRGMWSLLGQWIALLALQLLAFAALWR